MNSFHLYRWLYLEPILSSDEGELGLKFRKVDQGFRQVARILEADPRLSALLQSSRLQTMLDSISEQLLACQSALNQYIDDKRSVFPRFYFLSDDDLLELLGQARAGAEGREAVMQTHLKKLFPGSTGVRLGPGGMSITALCSQYGETLQLDHPVDIDCPVEVWLKGLESEMRSSLKSMTLRCIITKCLQEQDPFSLPTQILCLAQNIRFTENAEKAIVTKALHKLVANIEKENLYYVSSEVDDESERFKKQALILQCAYYISVLRTLIDHNVVSTSDWLWQKQLRFYLLDTKDVVAKMGLAQIAYSYEYLGVNTGQFVRTELADECFLILTQSLYLGLVGNPFGPAGTGKTESVKALGGLVGRLVLVFNCDEAMDSTCMGRLLSGLALSGAWGCFDELNRLGADTLAALSHQLGSLLDKRAATVSLNGKQVRVSEWCGVAATMNPAGRGYGGRRMLPAALTRLLRPVAMTEPRAEPLAARLLAAACVHDPHTLAADLNAVFTMASTLLSGERHYDWGLRAMKAAVGSFSALKAAREEIGARASMRRVLALNNLSKLTAYDAQRFQSILTMVFGASSDEENDADPISCDLNAAADSLGLVKNNQQIRKCIELYEQLQQRMGVVIVGPPGSGKTTTRRLLKAALQRQDKNIVEYTIYPKAMDRTWLLGNLDHDTRQWTDGVISTTALEVSNQGIWSWIVFDGDIDPEWVEALNSVLDDNRLLTLPSGWRVQFPPNVNFIFETHSLEHASPATISRLGIILLSDETCCAKEILDRWVLRTEFENETAKMALPLLQQVVNKILKWLSAHRSDTVLKVNATSMVNDMLIQFEYSVQNIETKLVHTSAEDLVSLAVQRSIMDVLKQSALDSFLEEMAECLGPVVPLPSCLDEWATDSPLPSPRLATRAPALRAALAADDGHLLIVGVDGCAKNLIADYILKENNLKVITIDCTPILQPADIIAELKRNNTVGGCGSSAGSEHATLLVRGLHRAHVDAWGSSAVHAFLLQLIQGKGLWIVSSEEEGGAQWSGAARLRVVATATKPVSCPRLAAAFTTVLLPEPDEGELLELVNHHLKQSTEKIIRDKEASSLARNMLITFKEVTETFYGRPHYKWNTTHLQKWCENIKWYTYRNTEEVLIAVSAEANLIFRDRLITDEEKGKFNAILRSHLKQSEINELYFASKLHNDGVYLEAVDRKDWNDFMQKIINQCLSEDENNAFGDCTVEVCSELAVLCQAMARATNGGVVVAVGSAGVGRSAAARLVATALSLTLCVVAHENDLSATIRNALSSSSEGNRTLLVIRESASGTAGTLAGVEALRRARALHCIPAQWLPTNTGNTQHVLDNIMHNLGIVICFDKDQDDLWDLMEKYPYLYKDSHLVWVDQWSEQTLREVTPLIIQRLQKEDGKDDSKGDDAIPVEGFVNIHKSLEAKWMKAPCRYVNFVKSYYYILNKKREALVQRQKTLSAGVEALKRARTEVATLEAEAVEQETALTDKQTKANEALDQIGATVRATTDRREEMHTLKKNIENENEKLQIRKKEIEAELASVEPIIAAARAAVGDIKPEALSEVRSLRAPPEVVRDVLEGVLRLMGIADTSWHSMKNFLSKRGVKEDIRCADANQMSSESVAAVERLVERRAASFEEKTARRASAACAPLAAWVHANLAHARALARIRPLQEQQRALTKNLKEAENELASLSSGLSTVEDRVNSLKTQLGVHSREAATLELKVTAARRTLAAATNLLQQLAHEYSAWEIDLEKISTEIYELNSRSLLAAAYVVFLPDLTEPQAKDWISKWSSIIEFEDSDFSVVNFLSSTEKQLKWDADGLASDKTAVKNAVFVDQFLEPNGCGFTPLLVDPDDVTMAWLKNMLSGSPCDFVSQRSERLQTAVQYAARLGRTLVITEAESIDRRWLRAGASVVVHSRDLTLPARLPSYLRPTLSVIYFTASLDGLTDQLVHYALQNQNPEVDQKSKEIKMRKATLQKQQHELQENLLRDLSTKADILNDENLLASLNKTRATSATIDEALEAARAIESATSAACETYEASAKRTALLALSVKQLAAQRPLINLPIDAVLDVFVDAIHNGGDFIKTNNDEVVKYVTRRVIERVLFSLHKRDKYIVVLFLLKQIYNTLIPEKLWHVFVGMYEINDNGIGNEIKNRYPWIPKECVKKVLQLKDASEDLFNKLMFQNEKLWAEFLRSGDLNVISSLKLGVFEMVVAVAALRPDSLYRAVINFTDQLLGVGAVSAGVDLGVVATWTGAGRGRGIRPALLLGAHAADELAAHAHTHALQQVGVEEGATAWEAAVEGARGGGWLALVVGASPFTQELQTFLIGILSQRPAEDFHPEFRLWIVSEDRDIPPLISSACVNVVLEAPEGVKHGVMGVLSAWGRYEADERAVRLRACLALFHAIVLERRGYIPQGWSVWYEWGWGEVSACAEVLRACALGGARALCLALYAARVSAPHDRVLLAALLRDCLTDPALAHAWRPRGTNITLPNTTRLQDYTAAFAALPEMDSPQLLGLPENCRHAWEKNAITHILSGIKELKTNVLVDRKSDPAHLKMLLALWKKLMSGCPLIKPDYTFDKEVSGWWGCVSCGEAREAARTARLVHTTLTRLARGAAPWDTALHKTPEEWQLSWCGPAEPDVYLREFSHRAHAALSRLAVCDVTPEMPNEVDLRLFLRPERVICALRARSAEQLACAEYALALATTWGPRDHTQGDLGNSLAGVVVVGLELSGAAWDGTVLCPAAGSAPPHAVAPPILLRYYKADTPVAAEGLNVPVYSSVSREQLLATVRAPLARDYAPAVASLHAPALFVPQHT